MSAPKINPTKPFVLFLYGFPGSGKTAFARQLAEEINMAHLQQDRLSHELYEENTERFDKYSRNAMDFMAREFLRAGVSLVYDASIPRLAERRILRDEVRKLKATPVMVWVQIDPDTAFNRTQSRDRRKADDHFAKSYTSDSFGNTIGRMQNPDNEDYVVISGKHTFQTQRSALYKKLYDLGVLTPSQMSQNLAKPGLVNLVPQQNIGGRADVTRRNIHIR